MSHTMSWSGLARTEVDPRHATVHMHHDSGPSGGSVTFMLPSAFANAQIVPETADHRDPQTTVVIPFKAIRALVLNHYRNKMIGALEQTEGAELEQLLMAEMTRKDAE